MRGGRACAGVFAALVVSGAALACAGVRAQAPEGAAPAPRASPAAPELDERERFLEAMRLFRAQRYDEVLPILLALYAAHSEPLYLFNLGQTYRMQGDCASARDAYRRYLETPMPDATAQRRDARHSAREYVRALEPCPSQAASMPAHEAAASTPPPVLPVFSAPAATEPAAAPAPVGAAEPAGAPARAVPVERERPHSRRAALWASGLLFGTGAGCAIAAGYWGFKARALESSLEERFGGETPARWDEQAEQDFDAGEQAVTRARWIGAAAVLSVAAGSLVLLLTRRERARPRQELSLLPRRRGAEVGWTSRF
jgi:hypothetical protein